jgi:hypothetical protein
MWLLPVMLLMVDVLVAGGGKKNNAFVRTGCVFVEIIKLPAREVD